MFKLSDDLVPTVRLSVGHRHSCDVSEDSDRQDEGIGADALDLLQGVQDYSSIQEAARHTGMPLSQAEAVIEDAEKQLGFRLVISQSDSDGAKLTRSAWDMLRLCSIVNRECNGLAHERFRNVLGGAQGEDHFEDETDIEYEKYLGRI